MTVSGLYLQVEELSAAAAHRKVSNVRPPVCRLGSCFKQLPLERLEGLNFLVFWWQEGKGDPLEKYCGDNPEADECRCASLSFPKAWVCLAGRTAALLTHLFVLQTRACLFLFLPECGVSLLSAFCYGGVVLPHQACLPLSVQVLAAKS